MSAPKKRRGASYDPKRTKEIVEDRNANKMTYQAIADKYGFSKQRAHQIVDNYMRNNPNGA